MDNELAAGQTPKVEADGAEPELTPVSAFANARKDAAELAGQDALAASTSVEVADQSALSHAAVFDPALDGQAQGPAEWLEGSGEAGGPDTPVGDGVIAAPEPSDRPSSDDAGSDYNERVARPVPVSRSFSTEAREDSQRPGRALLIEGIVTLAIAAVGVAAVVSHGCKG